MTPDEPKSWEERIALSAAHEKIARMREEIIEKCAKVCDRLGSTYDLRDKYTGPIGTQLFACADKIRALKC